jgi:predicted ester cyclase
LRGVLSGVDGRFGTLVSFRRFYEDARRSGDVTAVGRFLDEDFVNHEIPDVAGSHREACKQAIVETHAACPDWTTEILDLISDGDKVAARWQASGTHTGKLPDLEPTGARVRTRGITIVYVSNGKITDFWKTDDPHTVPNNSGTHQNATAESEDPRGPKRAESEAEGRNVLTSGGEAGAC